jgi:hypothetical protein
MAFYTILPFDQSVKNYEEECIIKIKPVTTIDLDAHPSGGGWAYFLEGLPSYTNRKDLVRYSWYTPVDNNKVFNLWVAIMTKAKNAEGFIGARVIRYDEFVGTEIWADGKFKVLSEWKIPGTYKKITEHK